MSKSEFYVQKLGTCHGPFTQSQLIQLAKQSKITAESQVRKGPDGPWHFVGKIRGLKDFLGGNTSPIGPQDGPKTVSEKVDTTTQPRPDSPVSAVSTIDITRTHNTRCPKCKTRIYDLLRHIHGHVDHKYKAVGVSVEIWQYSDGSKTSEALTEIYEQLVASRGFDDFVRTKNLHACDLFVPSIGSVVETDEYQHFTERRAISLSHYPDWFAVGFDRDQFLQYCRKKNAKDNDPPHRDEQRAWYDTLRDFLPAIIPDEVTSPTIRIPLGFHEWCFLDIKNDAHVRAFRELTGV